MTNENLKEIEEKVGHNFRNADLLQQAFIRRSYSQENGGENNEVLEFIGDSALDMIVVKILGDYYGSITKNERHEFHSNYDEGKLTDIKKNLVGKTMLAHRIDILGLNEYLIMGNGDEKHNIKDEKSVKEDLFEAIIGAVAIDTNYDLNELINVANSMLDPLKYIENGFDIDERNYIAELQHWHQCFNNQLPKYTYYQQYSLIKNSDFYCRVLITDPEYIYGSRFLEGVGNSKNSARMNAAELACEWLEENGYFENKESFREIVGDPNEDTAVSQLNTLATKGLIKNPEYTYSSRIDKDGSTTWKCSCNIEGYEYYFWNESSSKKNAKKQSAYKMLWYIIEK